MPWTTPGTAVAGNVLTAAQWNSDVRDNTNTIRASQINVQSAVVVASTFSVTGSTFTNVTGLTVTITPSSATSKILVIVSIYVGSVASGRYAIKVTGGNMSSLLGTTAGSRQAAHGSGSVDSTNAQGNSVLNLLDSPATTSATTYQVQLASTAGATAYLNRTNDDSDSANVFRPSSTITAIEIPT